MLASYSHEGILAFVIVSEQGRPLVSLESALSQIVGMDLLLQNE